MSAPAKAAIRTPHPRAKRPDAASPPRDVLRVCMIISSFRPLIGGAERVTESLCAELRRQGVDVRVLTRRYPGLDPRDTISGIPVRRVGHPSRTKAGALTFGLHALWLLATRLRDHRLVHVQNPDTPLLVGFAAKLLLRRKLFVTIQSDPKVVFSREDFGRHVRLRLMGRFADVVGVQSRWMADELQAEGVPSHRLRMLPNAVDSSLFTPPSDLERRRARIRIGLPESAMVYLFVGRLVALKRVNLLLEAWAGQPPEGRGVLIILGDGPERGPLRAVTESLGLSDVTFERATDDVVPYLRAADVFVIPSSVEGLSLALLEAMASGLCVVVSDLPANTAVIHHGENGLTFPVDDLKSLGQRLLQARSANMQKRLGARAVETVRDNFSLTAIARLHVQTYDRASR